MPVGDNCMYDEQFSIVSKNQELAVVELSPPSVWKKTSPLRNFNWSKGSLRFEFIRYDHGGVSEFEHFQVISI